MSKASKPPAPKVTVNNSIETEEFKTKVFAKSGWPKTVKDYINLTLNLFVSLLN